MLGWARRLNLRTTHVPHQVLPQGAKTRVQVFADIQNFALRAPHSHVLQPFTHPLLPRTIIMPCPKDILAPGVLPPEGEGWHKASVLGCLPLAVPIGLSPLLILTLSGSECVLVVSMEPGGGGLHAELRALFGPGFQAGRGQSTLCAACVVHCLRTKWGNSHQCPHQSLAQDAGPDSID